MWQKYYCCLLLVLPINVMALELFGVVLSQTTSRTELRNAVKNSGAEVVREAGDDNWFDIYNHAAVFEQSQKLYIGYDKQSTNFAFAEYQLPYEYIQVMLQRLEAKYGKAERRYATFDSDIRYLWLIDGVEVSLQQDWHAGVSRLQYSVQENLQRLQQAFQQSKDEAAKQQLNTNVNYF